MIRTKENPCQPYKKKVALVTGASRGGRQEHCPGAGRMRRHSLRHRSQHKGRSHHRQSAPVQSMKPPDSMHQSGSCPCVTGMFAAGVRTSGYGASCCTAYVGAYLVPGRKRPTTVIPPDFNKSNESTRPHAGPLQARYSARPLSRSAIHNARFPPLPASR